MKHYDICIICHSKKPDKFLNPKHCHKEHGDKSHRICHNCWFGTQGYSHSYRREPCPGCCVNIPKPKDSRKSLPIHINDVKHLLGKNTPKKKNKYTKKNSKRKHTRKKSK